MEQVKALNALEPFLALSKSANSPRAAADLITRATSAPNTFLFAELLQTPQIQALSTSDAAPHLRLLEIFSYGTYQTYKTTPGLPDLNDAQTLKLRQLSLATLAANASSTSSTDGSTAKNNLSYESLQQALDLPSRQALERTVISATYAGLITAKLDPAGSTVRVSSVAPLRDLAPGSTPTLLASLRAWSDRCTDVLATLEEQVADVKARAAAEATRKREWEEQMAKLVEGEADGPVGTGPAGKKLGMFGKGLRSAKRVLGARGGGDVDDEAMDVDEEDEEVEGPKRGSKRKA